MKLKIARVLFVVVVCGVACVPSSSTVVRAADNFCRAPTTGCTRLTFLLFVVLIRFSIACRVHMAKERCSATKAREIENKTKNNVRRTNDFFLFLFLLLFFSSVFPVHLTSYVDFYSGFVFM